MMVTVCYHSAQSPQNKLLFFPDKFIYKLFKRRKEEVTMISVNFEIYAEPIMFANVGKIKIQDKNSRNRYESRVLHF